MYIKSILTISLIFYLPVFAELNYSEDAIKVRLSETTRAIDSEEVTPKTWKNLKLLLIKEDNTALNIGLLRPDWWVQNLRAYVGNTIYLDMPEMGAVGYAEVLSISDTKADSRKATNGFDMVTGTFSHISDEVFDLYFKALKSPLGVTKLHPIWSTDRNGWVKAGDLRIGEHVKTKQSYTILQKKIKRNGKHKVFNLEVHKSHTFYVSELAILVHNSCFPEKKELAKKFGISKNKIHDLKKIYLEIFLIS